MPMLIGKFHKLIQNKLLWGVFLGVVVIAFVGLYMVDYLVPSADEQNAVTAGQVDGEDVSHQTYRQAYVNSYLSLALAVGRAFQVNDTIDKQLRNSAWKRLAAMQKVKEMKLVATDKEVVEAIRTHPGFSDQGQFNKAIYGAFVARVLRPMGITDRRFEEYIREEIGMNKLRQMLSQSVLVTPFEMHRTFNSISDSFGIEYVAVTEETVADDVVVTDEDARNYFEENKEALMLPAKVRVDYVRFPVADYSDDIEVTEDEMLAYYEENILDFTRETNMVDEADVGKTGEDSSDIVDADETAEDIEAIAEEAETAAEEAIAETEDVADDMPEALVQDAFMSEEEFADYDAEEDSLTKPFDEVKAEIEEILRTRTALYRTADFATDFVVSLAPDREGNAVPFETAAEKANLEILSLDAFSPKEELEGIESPEAFKRDAFSRTMLPDDYFSDAILGTNYVYVLALKEIIDPQVPEFEDVAEDVMAAVRAEATIDELQKRANEIKDAAGDSAEGSKSFADVAADNDLEVVNPVEFTAAAGIEDNPYSDAIVRTALFLNEDEVSDPVPTEDALLVIHVKKRTPGDPTTFATIREQLVGSIVRERAGTLFQSWRDSLLDDGNFTENLPPEPEEEL